MKKIKKIAVLLFCVMIFVTAVPTAASSKPAAPRKVKVKSGTYYSYWKAHKSELTKAGIYQGDVYDATISWKAAKKANGYKVTIYWNEEGRKDTTTVNVTKRGSKYTFSTKGTKSGTRKIAKDEKSFITKGSKSKFTSSKLSFQVSGDGSCIKIEKVVIKSYRKVKGKKVYSKAVTKKV